MAAASAGMAEGGELTAVENIGTTPAGAVSAVAAAVRTDMAAASAGMAEGGELTAVEKIETTPAEAYIFELLRDVVDSFKIDARLDVMGEWVLAKILGRNQDKIYVAVSGMSARLYCDTVIEYIRESIFSIGRPVIDMRMIKDVRAPCISLFGKLVYFLNIKTGTFSGNGSSLLMERPFDNEDLYHGDLTINSLLFNINDSVVKDVTGRGYEDIRGRLVVTPSKNTKLLLNDPLVMLRAIRFAATLNFRLDEYLLRAAQSSKVIGELATKISRKRISREVSLMLASDHPVRAMKFVLDMGLFHTVFRFPLITEPRIDKHCDRTCVSKLQEVWNLLHSIETPVLSGIADPRIQAEHRIICLYASLFVPLSETVYIDENNEKAPVAKFILQGAPLISGYDLSGCVLTSGPLKPLKMNDLSKSVAVIHSNCVRFAELVTLLECNAGLDILKKRLEHNGFQIPSESVKRVYAGIDNIWEVGPLLDRESIRFILQLQSNDPSIDEWQERLLKWQILNPAATVEECTAWTKSYHHLKKTSSVTTLREYFSKRSAKINLNENGLLQRVPILDKNNAVRMKDNCCRVVSSWVELVTGEHVLGRSWNGSLTLDSFGVDDKDQAYIIEKPTDQARSTARQNDLCAMSSSMQRVLTLDGQYPAYLSHLLRKLESQQHGPLTESMKLALDTHFALLTSEGRITQVYLIKLKWDRLRGTEREKFNSILQKCRLPKGWLENLRKVPIFKKIIEWAEDDNDNKYANVISLTSCDAFELLRHYFTHAPGHIGEPGMALLKHNEVVDLTAHEHLGDFAADVNFRLIAGDVDIKRGKIQLNTLAIYQLFIHIVDKTLVPFM
ncbi:hypothetical protein ACP70R_040504 [Stipagrostis hirtigluma subsp. patula]